MTIDDIIKEWDAFKTDYHRSSPISAKKYDQLVSEVKRLQNQLKSCEIRKANLEIQQLVNIEP